MIIINFKGGIGNQLFQYAFYLYIKKHVQEEIFIDTNLYKKIKMHNGFLLNNIFNTNLKEINIETAKKYSNNYYTLLNKILKKVIGLKKSHIVENQFSLDKIKNLNVSYLDGYWQNPKYVFENDNLLRKKIIYDVSKKKYFNLIKEKNSVSIHIRRGDYLNHNDIFGNICTEEYYKRAINLVFEKIDDPYFFIFSDDIKWAKNNFGYLEKSFFLEGNKDYEDLFLMSECKHNIIANSSFSWWASWLNKNPEKIIISPSRWYNDYNNNRNNDLILESFLKIDNRGELIK